MIVWRYVVSAIFVVQMYLVMAVLSIVYLPWMAVSPMGARRACWNYCRWVRWTARWMLGLRSEIRGTVPDGEILVAAKHQSFFDILLIFGSLPAAKFIMKRELLFAPILGQYAYRIGCVPVDRGRRGRAIEKMLSDVRRGLVAPGQLVIYPQGTRIDPGVAAPYKRGTHVLYEQLSQACVPVATNVGLFWPRRGLLRRPGTAVVEFGDPIPPGLPKAEFMARLEAEIERQSDRLMAEAGWPPLR